jgi:hypothetical protein
VLGPITMRIYWTQAKACVYIFLFSGWEPAIIKILSSLILLLLWFSRAKVTPIHRHRGVILGYNEFAAVGDPWRGG